MVLKTALTACMCLSLLGASSAQESGGSAELDASTILARTRDLYANCRSYRDAGVVEALVTHFAPSGIAGQPGTPVASPDRNLRPFRTAFQRPGKFRFEFSDARIGALSRHIVWEDGADVRTWWSIGEERFGSLMLAVVGAVAESGGSAHTVPCLLMPLQLSGAPVTKLKDAERLPDAALEDVPCFRIKGLYTGTEPTTLWIEQRSFLLRRIDREADVDGQHVAATTTYEPEIDVEIGAGELAFDPPAELPRPNSRSYVKRTSEEDVEPRFERARHFVDTREYDAALIDFKWLWDATNNPDSAFEPSIRDPIIKAIGQLAAVHPATQDHFGAVFDGLDATVRNGSGSSARSWTDWADLGRALKLDDRIVQLYIDRRSPTGSIRMFTDIHPYAFDDLLDILIERKQFAEAAALYEDPVQQAKGYYASVQQLTEASGPARWTEPADMLHLARDQNGFLFALTFAADRTAEADEIARFALERDDTVEARRALVLACQRMRVRPPALHVWIAEIRARGGDVSDLGPPGPEVEDAAAAAPR